MDACLWGLEEKPTERLLTETEIQQQLAEWKKQAEQKIPENDEADDTTPLSRIEIALKLFEGRFFSVLGKGDKMSALYFLDLPEIKDARKQLRASVGIVMEDTLLDALIYNNRHLFL